MNFSRSTILLLCTAVATITSIGMSTFSLFLPPIEREFGLSRALATLPYMVAMLGWAGHGPKGSYLLSPSSLWKVLFGKLSSRGEI